MAIDTVADFREFVTATLRRLIDQGVVVIRHQNLVNAAGNEFEFMFRFRLPVPPTDDVKPDVTVDPK